MEAVRDADPLSKAWTHEFLRIGELTELESWEELLEELTVELKPTMNKVRENRPRNGYDRFLIDVLQLLVLPNPDDPQGDRDKVVAMSVVRKPRCTRRRRLRRKACS